MRSRHLRATRCGVLCGLGVGLALSAGAAPLSAQRARRAAVAVGYSPAASILGAEVVGWPRGGHVGAALGVGIGGVGGRLNLSLAGPAGTRRRVPWVGVAHAQMFWLTGLGIETVTSAEVGLQFWPVPGGHFYADLGSGISRVQWARHVEIDPVLHVLIGYSW